ncbi:MAG: ATP-dependent 6-phosphofructokinase [Polyangiaceae bacterium]|nr:ATP-dependent 6-phosphofructokinase [Polyangiaceae bacterium]
MEKARASSVLSLGPRLIPSPLGLSRRIGDDLPPYVADDALVLKDVEFESARAAGALDPSKTFERAGPREHLYFEPAKTRVAIVTAGGLCPGINNVVRSAVLQLVFAYGVKDIFGVRYGFDGLNPASKLPLARLGPDNVRHIHTRGGTVLGTARGLHPPDAMLETLMRERIDVLLVIGGDGSMRGAHVLFEEAARRGVPLAVVGVPKTIDNDVAFVDKTFGFETAVAHARDAIDAAHTEAVSTRNGIGLVKLMGRDAGFIAAHASIASHDVNACLVPEVPYELEGPAGLLAYLEHRLVVRGHAVVVAAEGCGRSLAANLANVAPNPANKTGEQPATRDASGNLRFSAAALDIGPYLKDTILRHFAGRNVAVVLKYIDPSYMLRGVAADAMDAVFCDALARDAVHAAMAGKTDVMVGRWNGVFTHVPLPLALSETKRIDPNGELWRSVIEATGQPRLAA